MVQGRQTAREPRTGVFHDMIKATLDVRDFKVWANEKKIRATDFSPCFQKDIWPMVTREIRGHFQAGGRPDKWAALKASTLRKRLPAGQVRQSILWITGQLMSAASSLKGLKRTIGPHSLTAEPASNKWGQRVATHHAGGTFYGPPIRAKKAKALCWIGADGKPVFAKSTGPRHFTRAPRPILTLRPVIYRAAALVLTAWLMGKRVVGARTTDWADI